MSYTGSMKQLNANKQQQSERIETFDVVPETSI